MPARSDAVDEAIRALYQGPLAEFVAARQALARRLKKEKDKQAASVAELRKPSLSAWAVNQLFAHEVRAMAALVEAGVRARAAQERASAGGEVRGLREALASIREEVPRLAARGVELLATAERAPGEAIAERVRVDLEALALDPANEAVAARGWLDDDLPPPGFEVMAALQVAAAGARPVKVEPVRSLPAGPGPRPAAAMKTAAGRAPASAALPAMASPPSIADRRERDAQQRRERERTELLERLRADLTRAETATARQRRAADEAAAAAEHAAREAADAERRAVEARSRAREAKQAAASAEAVAAAARAAFARAERG